MLRTDDAMVLNRIPVAEWVCGTADKMREAGAESASEWRRFWLQTYWEPGGTSQMSGEKACPKAAAYALWYLGRIQDSGRQVQKLTIQEVHRALGKNAVYAVIAAELLHAEGSQSVGTLWPRVRARFTELLNAAPATSE